MSVYFARFLSAGTKSGRLRSFGFMGDVESVGFIGGRGGLRFRNRSSLKTDLSCLQCRCGGMGIYGNVAALVLGYRLCEDEESAMK